MELLGAFGVEPSPPQPERPDVGRPGFHHSTNYPPELPRKTQVRSRTPPTWWGMQMESATTAATAAPATAAQTTAVTAIAVTRETTATAATTVAAAGGRGRWLRCGGGGGYDDLSGDSYCGGNSRSSWRLASAAGS